MILKDEEFNEDQVRHFPSIAHTKSQRLEKLINELFEVTKMNYGMLPVEKKEIILINLLNQLKEELVSCIFKK